MCIVGPVYLELDSKAHSATSPEYGDTFWQPSHVQGPKSNVHLPVFKGHNFIMLVPHYLWQLWRSWNSRIVQTNYLFFESRHCKVFARRHYEYLQVSFIAGRDANWPWCYMRSLMAMVIQWSVKNTVHWHCTYDTGWVTGVIKGLMRVIKKVECA